MDDKGRERLSRIESKRKQKESIQKGGSGSAIGWSVFIFTVTSLPNIFCNCVVIFFGLYM